MGGGAGVEGGIGCTAKINVVDDYCAQQREREREREKVIVSWSFEPKSTI